MSVVIPFLVAVANVMGAGMILPQVIRLHRLKSTQGISGAWVGVGVIMNLWWATYATATGLWAVFPVGILGSLLYSIIAAQYIGLVGRGGWRQLALGGIGLGLVPIPALLFGGWKAAGITLGLMYGLQFLPAAAAAFRSSDPVGVSPMTWSMAWVEAGIWLFYGSTIGDVALVIGGGGGLLASTVILGRLAMLGDSTPRIGRLA
jgi:uncharacterized protein with PQ loop repeat